MSLKDILQVQNLGKTYRSGDQTLAVLREISFALAEGSTCAVIGPSGSGKTTLLAICAGLERPTSGTVILNGKNLGLMDENQLAQLRNREVGFIFQSFQLIPTLTALENVMVPAEIQGRNHARPRASELLEQVGLEDRFHHYPVQLSAGEQQRVALARAFINRPKILFADEPTGNLDAETSETVARLLFELNRVVGTTLVLVTHNPDLAAFTERIIQLRGGVIAADRRRSGGAFGASNTSA
ncbi:MAG: ABC transporter ATP-binding protein [Deltaproteobacteria bacterium]|nr:ABC transporter ATP-binding protein [Deltaproteobacteria bacterium]